MALDGLGKVNGNFKVTPPQIKQWQGPDGSYGMSWNMSWEYSASTQSQTNAGADAIKAGGPTDSLSLPGGGLSSAMGLDGQVKAAADSMWKQCCDQIAKCMEQLKGVMGQLGIGAAAVGGSTPAAGGPANSVPGAPVNSVPGSTPPGASAPPAGGPAGSAPPAGGGPEKPRNDGSKFLNIAQGVATILGGVGNMVGTIRNSGGGGGLFGGGGLLGGGGPGRLFGGGGGGGGLFGSPLTFDLNGNGKVGTTDIAGGRRFDLTGDGKAENTAWAEKGDGVLAFDADGNGAVGESGKELLGNYSDVDGDGKADGHANGFEALKSLATKHLGAQAVADGKLDAAELGQLEQKAGLKMHVDGKNVSLRDLGVSEIKVGYTEAGVNADAAGNQHRQVGAGFVRNGQVGKVDDVWFQYK